MARISTKAAKAKGRKFQQFIRDKFIELAHAAGLQEADTTWIESRQMGGAGDDIRFMHPEVAAEFPYYVECKQMATGFNPHLKFDEIANTLKRTNQIKHPLIFHRRDRHETLVTLSAEHFFFLMRGFYRQNRSR